MLEIFWIRHIGFSQIIASGQNKCLSNLFRVVFILKILFEFYCFWEFRLLRQLWIPFWRELRIPLVSILAFVFVFRFRTFRTSVLLSQTCFDSCLLWSSFSVYKKVFFLFFALLSSLFFLFLFLVLFLCVCFFWLFICFYVFAFLCLSKRMGQLWNGLWYELSRILIVLAWIFVSFDAQRYDRGSEI